MAAGPMKISFEDGTKPQHFLEQCTSNKIEFSHFRPFKIGTDIIEIEKTVTNIHIIGSYAAVSHFAISQQIKNLVSKSLILITCRGRPDILLRLFVNSLKKKYPYLVFTSQFDCDWSGFSFNKYFKNGSIACAYINKDLALPSLHNLGLSPFHLTAKSRTVSKHLTNNEIRVSEGLINSNKKNYAYTQAFIDQLTGSLFINKTSSIGGCANMAYPIDIFLNFINTHESQKLVLEPCDNGYFRITEKIDFSNAEIAKPLQADISALKTNVPNYIINTLPRTW